MTKLLWMTDLHYSATPLVGHDPTARINAAVSYINRHHDDALGCVISGDMAETGTHSEYTALKALLDQLAMPWFPMVGNHDDRTNLRAVMPLPDGAMDGFVQYQTRLGGTDILCLDTLIPGSAEGALCDERLAWLGARLTGDGPRLIFMHHPPLDLDLPPQGEDRLRDPDAFLDIATRPGAATHLFFGHVHRPVSGHVRGLPYAGLRSLLIQAPPPRPAWTWDSFAPVPEAPEIGIVLIRDDNLIIQYEQPCDAQTGT